MRVVSVNFTDKILLRKRRSAILFTSIMLLASYSAIEFGSWEALATSDDDGDGLIDKQDSECPCNGSN